MALSVHLTSLEELEINTVTRQQRVQNVVGCVLEWQLTKRSTIKMSNQVTLLDLVNLITGFAVVGIASSAFLNGITERTGRFTVDDNTEQLTIDTTVVLGVEPVTVNVPVLTGITAITPSILRGLVTTRIARLYIADSLLEE
jgi:hypothetical protein